MSPKPLISLTSALACVSLIAGSFSAEAGNTSQAGTWSGNAGHGSPAASGPSCKQSSGGGNGHPVSTGIGSISVYKPVTVNNNVSVYKPVTVNNDVNVYKPITVNNSVEVYKPVTITNNIDDTKNINITNNINASKNIDINKTIIINKGGQGGGSSQSSSSSQADAQAEAMAIASAVAAASSNSSSSAAINFYANNSTSANANSTSYNNSGNSESSSSAFGYSGSGTTVGSNSYIADTASAFAGGDLGNLNVDMAPTPITAAPTQCTFQDTTVIKAIHAVCISADSHEFPASHMTGSTWIDASYEGEIARCIPGSHLKIVVGKITQSGEGMAAGYTSGQVLECAFHEALWHYKDGMLKCAPAAAVPDCTERTNLRKYGSGDMFFTYRAKICLETHEEYPTTASIGEDRR